MNIIDLKLIDAYSTLVLSGKYITYEAHRENETQLLVPSKYTDAVDIQVAERIILGLDPGSGSDTPIIIKGELQQRLEDIEKTIDIIVGDSVE